MADRKRPLHSIPRLIVENWILGAAAGVLCASIVLAIDLVHLRTLIWHSSEPWIALALLYGGFILTFASLLAGTAVMTMKIDED